MSENDRMYELEYPAPGTGDPARGIPLVIALQGYADAGQGVQQSAQHLLQALEHRPVATFDVDALVDYRSRRPGVTIDRSRLVGSEDLSLTLHRLEDSLGHPFLLLEGPEPDLRWNAFSRAVTELSTSLGVERAVALYAAPMTVPHTRPLVVSAHASDPALVADLQRWESRMIIPGSAALRTELSLAKAGVETVGLTAHVPHYIAASDYPEATYGLLHAVERVGDLELPLRALQADMEKVRAQLAEQVEESGEIGTVVAALERQYDEEMARLRRRQENSLLAPGEEVPSGEELGAEFERFLAGMSGDSRDGTDGPEDAEGPDGRAGHPEEDD
ncbi:PAC2 family protein [uncultured Corynebacterium sp.]|uniref:PAC2 family protein n=1 Tax=uncultured Corynebacterium sp. TaxID=159447 RepID=UPI0025F8B0A3|nr:PAC2 family protein [uncultured Corynebacterium sp.]